MDASVTPSSARTAACPSAVAPPWLPMQGTRYGSPPARADGAGERGEQRDEVPDPAAPDADGDAVARGDPVLEPERREQLRRASRDVVQARSLDDLPHAQQVRELRLSGRVAHG